MFAIARLTLASVVAAGALTVLATDAEANPIIGGGFSASYAGESAFTQVGVGDSGQFSAIFFNDGTQTWTPGGVGLLVCAPDKITCNVSANQTFNRGWFSPTVYATVTAPVLPGQNAFFVYGFTVPLGTPVGTATAFYGDVGLIATGALIRPQGYFQVNTVQAPTFAVTPASASVAIGAFQQFTAVGQPVGTSLAWSVSGGCGAITTAGLFVATVMNSPSQPCTVVASAGGKSVTAAVTVFGNVTQLGCSVTPSLIAADGGTQVAGTAVATVSLRDGNGNTVANASAPVLSLVNVTPTLAQMSPVGSVVPSAGVARVTITSTTLAGDVQLSASAAGFTGCNVVLRSSAAGPAAKVVPTFLTSPIAADGASASTLRIDVTDASGVRVVSDNLTQITVSSASGTGVCSVIGVTQGTNPNLAAGTAVAASGRVAFTVQSTRTAGTCLFVVSANNASIMGGIAALTTLTVGVASNLVIVSSSSPRPASNRGFCDLSGTASDPSCTTIVVAVQDANGVLLTGDNGRSIAVGFNAAACTGAGAGDVVQRGTTTTSVGKATFVFSSAGAYSSCAITFTSPNLVSATATAVWTPGSPDHLSCSFSPNTLPAYAGGSATGTVMVRDVLGNLTSSGGTYSVTLTRTSGSTTSLVPPNYQYTSSGIATFTVLKAVGNAGLDTYTPGLNGGSLPNVVANTACTIAGQ